MRIKLDRNNISQHILKIDHSAIISCPYCKNDAIFNQGYWRCNPCDSQIKTEVKSQKPIGTMANKPLRLARSNLKRVFGQTLDYWINEGLSKTKARRKVILEICKEFNIEFSDFNIDCFDSKLCAAIDKHLKTLNLRKTPICPYCSKPSVFIESKSIYRCEPCDAQVGIHKHNKKPLGSLANAELRKARMAAHAKFDTLWRRKMAKDGVSSTQARKKAYSWLSSELKLSIDNCHIALFDVDQCSQVEKLCDPYLSAH